MNSAAAKAPRTKRPRAAPPLVASPSTSTADLSESVTEEEEDMANCLILLARGRAPEHAPKPKEPSSSSSAPVAAVYECKDCNKYFPSFQALGGHRTSHRKTKMPSRMEGNHEPIEKDDLQLKISTYSFSRSSAKARVHDCSICGAEFSSGQALGGHMRRHRSVPEAAESKKEGSFLGLDLNLPAPSDEDCDRDQSMEPTSPPAFAFANKQPPPPQPPLVFLTSAMVDCHY